MAIVLILCSYLYPSILWFLFSSKLLCVCVCVWDVEDWKIQLENTLLAFHTTNV